jgi:hypothetical protein
MRTLAVTFGDHFYQWIAKAFAKRFEELNGIEAMAIDPLKCPNLEDPIWVKAWLWDLVPEDVDRIIWFDADNVPIAPIADLLPSFDYPFCAVLDLPETVQEAVWKAEEVRACDHYFNMGFFVAQRVTRPVFEDLKGYVDKDLGFADQSAFNVCLARYYDETDLGVLPKTCNWLQSSGATPNDIRMFHLAGMDGAVRLQVLRGFARVFDPLHASTEEECTKEGSKTPTTRVV